jgi:hypothetical protein
LRHHRPARPAGTDNIIGTAIHRNGRTIVNNLGEYLVDKVVLT